MYKLVLFAILTAACGGTGAPAPEVPMSRTSHADDNLYTRTVRTHVDARLAIFLSNPDEYAWRTEFRPVRDTVTEFRKRFADLLIFEIHSRETDPSIDYYLIVARRPGEQQRELYVLNSDGGAELMALQTPPEVQDGHVTRQASNKWHLWDRSGATTPLP
jgi:hypothetical protein